GGGGGGDRCSAPACLHRIPYRGICHEPTTRHVIDLGAAISGAKTLRAAVTSTDASNGRRKRLFTSLRRMGHATMGDDLEFATGDDLQTRWWWSAALPAACVPVDGPLVGLGVMKARRHSLRGRAFGSSPTVG